MEDENYKPHALMNKLTAMAFTGQKFTKNLMGSPSEESNVEAQSFRISHASPGKSPGGESSNE